MVGSELPDAGDPGVDGHRPRSRSRVTDLTVKDDDGRPLLDDVSFTVHRGEIVGIAGVEGNGQTELIEAIIGIEPLDSRDRSCSTAATSPRSAHRAPAGERHRLHPRGPPARRARPRRRRSGRTSVLGHQTQPPFATGPLDRPGGARSSAPSEIIDEFDVRTPGAGRRRAACPAATSRS